jgi:uncharacterized protein HemX
MAIVIVLAIAGAGFYYWRTHRTLKTVEGKVSGNAENHEGQNNREEKNLDQKPGDDNSSQK